MATTITLTVSAPRRQGSLRHDPWMIRLLFVEPVRPEHRTLMRDHFLKPWCEENCAGKWEIVKTKYAYFWDETDATMFYLRHR